jgi:hypothetical protein
LSNESDDVKAAASKLTHAMEGLLRAIDAAADESTAAASIPEALSEDLERLAARLDAASGPLG